MKGVLSGKEKFSIKILLSVKTTNKNYQIFLFTYRFYSSLFHVQYESTQVLF